MSVQHDFRPSRAQLRAHYERWRELTRAEGEAIRAADWTRVRELQAAKQALPPLIATAGTGLDQEIKTLIAGLIEQESANNAALAEQRKRLESQWQILYSARNNLQQLQKTYAADAEPVWQSYS